MPSIAWPSTYPTATRSAPDPSTKPPKFGTLSLANWSAPTLAMQAKSLPYLSIRTDCWLRLGRWTALPSCGTYRWARSTQPSRGTRESWSRCISTQTETSYSRAPSIRLPSSGTQGSENPSISWSATRRKSPARSSSSPGNTARLHRSTAPVGYGM